MAFVSQFSTADNLAQMNQALDRLDVIKKEVELALQAGIPGAQANLDKVDNAINTITSMKNIYFPNGLVPSQPNTPAS